METQTQTQTYEQRQQARASRVKILQAQYPELVPNDRNSLVTAAKNVRIELKRAFPGVKFSVRTERFSGGDAMRIGWVDGPTTKQVDAITDKYSAGHFNGMEDIYEYRNDDWTVAFGDAKYVTTSRDNSDEAIAAAIEALKVEYHADAMPSVEEYKAGNAWRSTPLSGTRGEPHWSWQSLIGRKLAETAR